MSRLPKCSFLHGTNWFITLATVCCPPTGNDMFWDTTTVGLAEILSISETTSRESCNGAVPPQTLSGVKTTLVKLLWTEDEGVTRLVSHVLNIEWLNGEMNIWEAENRLFYLHQLMLINHSWFRPLPFLKQYKSFHHNRLWYTKEILNLLQFPSQQTSHQIQHISSCSTQVDLRKTSYMGNS
jgi:hypothetical protein